MNICFFPADLSGPGMLRCLLPGNELNKQYGYDCYTTEISTKDNVIFSFNIGKLPHADIYVLHQRPERIWIKLIPELQARGSIVVCDTDDSYLHLPVNHPAKKALGKDAERILHKIYGLADCLTVSTPALKRHYEGYNERIEVLPNYLDAEMWADIPDRPWEGIRIGWQGVSDIRMWDLRVLQGIIGPFLKRNPGVKFVAAGDSKVHDLLSVPYAQRVSYDKVQWAYTPQITATMDVGLVPLELNEFNEAKSHLKGMEYNACGIPYIASPSSSYLDWTEVGKNGFLARRPRDWNRHLELLCSDAERRKKMGAYGRKKALASSIQNNAWQWKEVYTSLSGDWADQLTRTAIARGALQKPPEFSSFLRYLQKQSLNVIVEIGTAQGGTLGALCEMASDTALIVSIDLPGGDFGGSNDVYGERDTTKMASYAKKGQRIEFIQADSQKLETVEKLKQILDGRTIDLLFIDGDHSYSGVSRDYELYSSLGPRRIAFHDILEHHEEKRSQVHLLWNEIKETEDTKEFVNEGYEWGWGSWGGIGVVECG